MSLQMPLQHQIARNAVGGAEKNGPGKAMGSSYTAVGSQTTVPHFMWRGANC